MKTTKVEKRGAESRGQRPSTPGTYVPVVAFLLGGMLSALVVGCKPNSAETPSSTLSDKSAMQVFVSPSGNDANPGTEAQPLRTLEGARDALRRKRLAPGLSGPVTVFLRHGEYHLAQSFVLEHQDSGTQAAPIAFKAYPGESVRLMGGYRLRADQFVAIKDDNVRRRLADQSAVGNVLEIDLRAAGISDFGEISRRGYARAGELSKNPPIQLFVDSEPQQIARWPNDGTVRMGEILDPGPLNIPATKEGFPPRPNQIKAELNPAYARMIAHLTGGATEGRIPAPDYAWQAHYAKLHQRGGTFTYDYDRPALWQETDDLWIAGIFGFSWEWSYNRVAKIDRSARTITLAHGEMSGIHKNWLPDGHHFENLLEEIDSAGEYYVDRKAGKLYLFPPPQWGDNVDITVSTAAYPLVVLQNASFITISDVDIGPGRMGGVAVTGGQGVHLENLRVRSVAGSGIAIVGGSDHCVSASRIHHVGKAGIELGGGDWATLTPSGHRVRDNVIHDVAFFSRVYNGAVNILPHSVGHLIANNRMFNLPHLAITVYGNNHVIEYNDISHSCELSDMGAIYMNLGLTPSQRGTTVRRNYFHNIGSSDAKHVNAVYPDNQTMGLTIEENIFFNMENAIQINSGSWIVVRNNLFVDVALPLVLTYHAQGAFDMKAQWREAFRQNNFSQMPHGTAYPELLRFWEEDRDRPDTNIFEGNVLFNPNVPLKHSDGIEHPAPEKLQTKGTVLVGPDNNALQVVDGKLRVVNPSALRALAPGFPMEVAEHFKLLKQP